MPIALSVNKSLRLPSYVDAPVPEIALRREHSIAKKHLPGFIRAYLKVIRSIYDPATIRDLKRAINLSKKGELTIEQVVEQVGWFDGADPLSVKRWELLGASLERSYTSIIEDAGESEVRTNDWPMRFEVTKADEIAVPTNPFSISWVRLKSASIVSELSNQQRDLLRQILTDSFENGIRTDAILEEIEQTVGLTMRERSWVDARSEQLAASGMTEVKAMNMVNKFGKNLLRARARRIARTETIDAYSQGLDDSWSLAKEQGVIEPAVMQKWVELSSSPRTCKICRGLGDSDPVPLGEPFISEFVGEIMRPPSHPNCRCTKVLIFPEGDQVTNLSRSNQDAEQARDILAGA